MMRRLRQRSLESQQQEVGLWRAFSGEELTESRSPFSCLLDDSNGRSRRIRRIRRIRRLRRPLEDHERMRKNTKSTRNDRLF